MYVKEIQYADYRRGKRKTPICQGKVIFSMPKYPLTTKNSPPILPAVESNVLSNPKDTEELLIDP